MRQKLAVATFLVAGLFSAQMLLGATQGGVRGRVLVNLQGLEGIPLTLVNVATGQSFSARTARDGSYSLSLPNGSYVVSSPGIRGLSIGKAPLLIQVTSGRFASANIEMARSMIQDAAGGVTIFHNPIGCVASNQFPVFDLAFQPAGSVVSARLYFKSNLSDEWFYTDFQALSGNFTRYKWTMAPDPANPSAMTQGDDIRRRWVGTNEPESIDPGVPPTHRAFLPKIQEGSGITEVIYYVQAALIDFTELRIRDTAIRILPKGQACKAGAFSAPAGAPAQAISVVTSGGLAGAPAGFGGVGFAFLPNFGGLVTGLLSVLPVVITEAVTGGESPTPPATSTPIPTSTTTPLPTPSPGAPPTPTPTPPPPGPAPTPTPTPTPPAAPTPSPASCQVQVSVNPPGGSAGPCAASFSAGGPLTTVTSSQTFTVPCSAAVNISAQVGPSASFVFPGIAAASWGGACTGDAIKSPCDLPPTLPSFSTVVLECGCDPVPYGFASTCGFATPVPLRP